MSECLTLELHEREIGVLSLDVPGQEVNTLHRGLSDEFETVLADLGSRPEVKAVVLVSGKANGFVAGADLHALQATREADGARALSELMQRATRRIAELPQVTVAAIHGDCLGGGLELALAFDSRVASDDASTRLGLPEVQLGLLPGGGGTQRLVPLVGLAPALDLMLTGRRIPSPRALESGLVDRVVPAHVLLPEAIAQARRLLAGGAPAREALRHRPLARVLARESLWHRALAGNPIGRTLAFGRARKDVVRKTRGLYPAPLRILDVVRTGLAHGLEAGLEAEARAFGELAVSPQSRALVNLFFATTELKKDLGTDDRAVAPEPIENLALVGAGLMGAGIAYVSAVHAGVAVTLEDRDLASARSGCERVAEALAHRVRRGRMSESEREQVMRRLRAVEPDAGLADADLVIEAVFEELGLKQQVLDAVESKSRPDTIFASNTSAIPISRIAQRSRRPQQVIGMHYFSPVERMPLLEVVVTPATSQRTVASCVAFGQRQGKTVVVVRDGPGFYTTRILAPYMNEAARLVSEGVAVDRVDSALMDFGFPMGPLALLDDVGIDVGAKVAAQMCDAFGDRMRPPACMAGLLQDQRQGRKNRRGFYTYEGASAARRGVDESVYGAIGVAADATRAVEGIAERCALLMVNEAVRCFEDGVLRNARDGDVAAVFGLGFPPFRGGPLRYVDELSPAVLVDRLSGLADLHGDRFAPTALLREMAESGTRFHGERAVPPP